VLTIAIVQLLARRKWRRKSPERERLVTGRHTTNDAVDRAARQVIVFIPEFG